MNTLNIDQRFAELDDMVSNFWQQCLERSPFIQRIMNKPVDKRLYALYMVETYHYTRHNARNQALVGALRDIPTVYQKFCFHHAEEETGHEFMALKDVQSLGVDIDQAIKTKPIAESEALIAYLYWVSMTNNPVGRLGYSYWAESVYGHINPVLNKIKSDLELQPKNMTFFVAHSDIDADHAEEVKEIIRKVCRDDDDWLAIARVAERSLMLTEHMLEGVDRTYAAMVEGAAPEYRFIRDLD